MGVSPAPIPTALRVASAGEMGHYHLVQLCKCIFHHFKGNFSCGFSQFKEGHEIKSSFSQFRNINTES